MGWMGKPKRERVIVCDEENKKLVVDENDDIIIVDNSSLDDVNVTIDNESVTLDGNLSYADNGYETLYSQDSYDSSQEESSEDYEIDTASTYPQEGDEYWTECNDSSEEPQSSVNIIIDGESTTADPNLSYYDQGYTELYTQDYYPDGGSPQDYEVNTNSTYPNESDTYWTYCNLEESTNVMVLIDGNTEYLDPNDSYINQGYSELYTQNTYPSRDDPSNYSVDTTSYPSEGDEYWTYCNPEEQAILNVGIDPKSSGYSFDGENISIGIEKLDIEDKNTTVEDLADVISNESGGSAKLYKPEGSKWILMIPDGNHGLYVFFDSNGDPLSYSEDLNNIELKAFLSNFESKDGLYITTIKLFD